VKREPFLRSLFGEAAAGLFLEGVTLFNSGHHWEAHEVFEDLWRLQEGEKKKFAQAFVQMAAGFSYIKKQRYESILYLFDKSIEKFAATSHLLPHTNISQLVDAMRTAKEEVRRLGETGLGKFSSSLYPRIAIASRSPRSRRKKAGKQM
jgi:hypothetical protein